MSRNDLTLADKIALLDQINGLSPKTGVRKLAEITKVSKSTVARVIQQEKKLREEWALLKIVTLIAVFDFHLKRWYNQRRRTIISVSLTLYIQCEEFRGV